MTKIELEKRVADLEDKLTYLLDVLSDVETALSGEDILGASAELGRLRPDALESGK